MKKILVFLALIIVTAPALAQGTVNFNNNVAFVTTADRFVYADLVSQTPLVGTNWVAQLYYGPTACSLTAVTNAPARFRAGPVGAGTWSGGTRTLIGFNPGDTVWLQVRVWDYARFPDWDSAVAGGGALGSSCVFTYSVPQAGAPPAAFFMENFRGMSGMAGCNRNGFTCYRSGNDLVLSFCEGNVWQGKDLAHIGEPLTNPPPGSVLRIPMTNEMMFFRVEWFPDPWPP